MDLMVRSEVLATTLATEFAPASNLRGEAAGAAWRYLLPTMEHGRVVCVGRPPAATLRTLVQTSGEVTVLATRHRPDDHAASIAVANVDGWLAERPDGTVDLVWIRAGLGEPEGSGPDADRPRPSVARARPESAQAAAVIAALPRLLAADGVIVREHRRRYGRGSGPVAADERAGGSPEGRVAAETDGRRTVWVAVRPDDGEIRSAVAEGDHGAAHALTARALSGPAVQPRWRAPRRVGSLVDRLVGPHVRRWLEISVPRPGSTMPDLPGYLVRCAAADGVDVAGWRWALSAIGVYNTQKVLGLLFAPGDDEPSMVVKMTRDATVVPRLENERDALRDLAAIGMADDGRVPRVRFAGRHAGLAIVGESALAGRAFRATSTGPASVDPATVDPATDAVAWLTDLAVRSARPAAAADVGSALGDLYGRYVALCRPDAGIARQLERALADVASSANAIPMVFQHGDPGTWNLLQREDGRVAFLDWENADAAGMPLWDLLYLLRSLAVGAGQRAGTRRRLVAVERYLLDDSPMSDFVVGAVERYTDALGMDRALVEPIFQLCWMHQAMKEATRVAPERVRNAHFNRLLRLTLDRRSAPNLRRIFEGGG